jgi:hypothetical protein
MIYKYLSIDDKIYVKANTFLPAIYIKNPMLKAQMWVNSNKVKKYLIDKYYTENQNLIKPTIKQGKLDLL